MLRWTIYIFRMLANLFGDPHQIDCAGKSQLVPLGILSQLRLVAVRRGVSVNASAFPLGVPREIRLQPRSGEFAIYLVFHSG